ncbi:putative polysaccharide biosynthesis protein [Alkaliphilus metalliredigens]|uniref:putative polysaccharide biosynthesis protein n=1 Tax=Alkaliphilus metalliredigens TaxID=208226 RepID=UPI00031B2275|nr:polysaccharide biosynthesis protein [Alkaliphilus metalliredigens]
MKKSSFLFGIILLTIVNFIVRSMGFVYRIILSRLIGAEAIGLYQMVFPFLMVLIAIPTAGIPVAVSKMVAKENSLRNHTGIYKILTIALAIGGTLSLFLSIFVSLRIEWITTEVLKNPRLYYLILFCIPSISLISFSSIIRGFFYGLKDMQPAATAQIIEQLTRIIFVLGYLYYQRPSSPIMSAIIAIIGISIGEFFGLLYLILRFQIKKFKNVPRVIMGPTESMPAISKSLLFIAVPLTLSRLISTLMQTVNAVLIPQRLIVAGYSSIEAVETFGKISGMAMPLLFLPFTVTSALVINLIPNVSEQMALNNVDDVTYKSNLAIRMTLLVAIPTMVVYAIFGNHLAELIYNHEEVGRYLSIISYGTLFLCMQHTISGILHGLGKQVVTTINYMLGMSIQLYCTYILVPNPKYGINGFFIGFLLSTFIIFVLNTISLHRIIKLKVPLIQSVIKPGICALFMIMTMNYSYHFVYGFMHSNTWSTLLASTLGILSYALALLVTKTLEIRTLMNIFRG